jgi:hypothetical protein
MKPIGLSLKKDGELMIVHRCLGCGKISPNRIAGDDNTCVITSLLEASTFQLNNCRIELLTEDDKDEVFTILYGRNYRNKA